MREPGQVSPGTDTNEESSSQAESPVHQTSALSPQTTAPSTPTSIAVTSASLNVVGGATTTPAAANNKFMRNTLHYQTNLHPQIPIQYFNLRQQLQNSGLGSPLLSEYIDNPSLTADNAIVKIEPPQANTSQLQGYTVVGNSRSPSDDDEQDGGLLSGKANPTLTEAHIPSARSDRP